MMPIFGTHHTERVREVIKMDKVGGTIIGVLLVLVCVWLIQLSAESEKRELAEGEALVEEVKIFLDSAEEIPFVVGVGYEISKKYEIYIAHVTAITAGNLALHVRAFGYPKNMAFEVPKDRISEFVWFLVGNSRHREPESIEGRHMIYEVEGWMLWRTTYYGPLPSDERVKLASWKYDDRSAKALIQWLTEN